jgi:hypothetical protein
MAMIAALMLLQQAEAQTVVAPYQKVVAMLDSVVATGSAPTLRVVIECLAIGDGDASKISDGLTEDEKAILAEAVTAHFATNPAFSPPLIESRPFPDLPDQPVPGDAAEGSTLSKDDNALMAATTGSNFILIVRIVDYYGGRFDLCETRANLFAPASKQRLALDVAWTSRTDGIIRALFIDGTRLK